MGKKKGKTAGNVFSLLWKRIFAGVLLFVPFYITYHIIRMLFLYIDGLSQPIVSPILGHRVRGVGFLLTFLLLYALGLIATNVVGRSFLRWLESLILHAPVIKNVYATAKEAIETISMPSKEKFKRVILIEYPRKGIYAIGFVTGWTKGADEKTLLNVFVPSPPNPATGLLVFVPESDAINTEISIEEAVKIIVSGGLIAPKAIAKHSIG